jgi:hypothetical protein
MFQTKVVDKTKTRILVSITSQKSRRLRDNVKKNIVEPHRLQTLTLHGACALHSGYPRLQTYSQNM